jgi:putative methylase
VTEIEKPVLMRDLGAVLDRLKDFENPSEGLEQYRTPGDLAALMLWDAHLRGDIDGAVVVDLGCGTGVLAYGSLLLGASAAVCLDVDWDALTIARENIGALRGLTDLVAGDVKALPLRSIGSCLVVMNPPFGVKKRGADILFLRSALRICDKVYSLHKYSPGGVELVMRVAGEEGFAPLLVAEASMTIKQRLKHHRRRVYRFKVVLFRFVRTVQVEEPRDEQGSTRGSSSR